MAGKAPSRPPDSLGGGRWGGKGAWLGSVRRPLETGPCGKHWDRHLHWPGLGAAGVDLCSLRLRAESQRPVLCLPSMLILPTVPAAWGAKIS